MYVWCAKLPQMDELIVSRRRKKLRTNFDGSNDFRPICDNKFKMNETTTTANEKIMRDKCDYGRKQWLHIRASKKMPAYDTFLDDASI